MIEKRQFLYGCAALLPMSVLALYFGLVIATRSFTYGPLLEIDHGCSFGLFDEVEDEVLLEDELYQIESSVCTLHKTAGSVALRHYLLSEPIRSYDPRIKKSGLGATIRPARAQRLWKRAQKKAYLRWPISIDKFWISSYYGPRTLRGRKRFHNGIDMAARRGTSVVAAGPGRVIEAQYLPGYGNTVVVRHPKRYKTRYAHLHRMRVCVGDEVESGQLIGTVGTTGNVAKSSWGTSASHLHFEVYCKEKRVDPFSFLA